MSRTLSQLVHDAGSGARVVFGIDGTPTSVSQLIDVGASYYSADASHGAVGVIMTNDRPTVEALLGAISVGATLVSLPTPGRGANTTAYLQQLRTVCKQQGIGEIVAADSLIGLLEDAGLPARGHSALAGPPLAVPHESGFSLLQFTSGSTSQPQGVLLDDEALGSNVTAILDSLAVRPGDSAVSWLPLSHDMGLVGMLLSGISAMSPDRVHKGHVVVLQPASFLRRPAVWLEAIGRWGGTVTAAPDFGYRMAAQRPLKGSIDLSNLRVAIVGGEIVRADTLESFTIAHAVHGFHPIALCPAYGLAEAGLAVALTRPDSLWRSRRLATEPLADQRAATPDSGEPTTTLVASGPPLPGFGILAGRQSQDNAIGQIAIQGPSLGRDPVTATSLADETGWYATGDAGFTDDGWLYVCGRTDDYLVAHGRNLYAPAIDHAVAALHGVRSGRVITVGLPTGTWTVAVESAARSLTPREANDLRSAIRRTVVQVTSAQPDDIVIARRGTLPFTPTGKPQRNELRSRLLRGLL